MMLYCHDQWLMQQQINSMLLWSRTHPVVSVGDYAYQTYLTLEYDHLNWYFGVKMTGAGIAMMLAGPETALLGVIFAGAGLSEMLLGTEEVWSAAFMPTMTNKTYEEQIHDWPLWFI